MTQPPPPPPPNDTQGINIPFAQLTNIARTYCQWRPIIGMAARFARQKIPKELDEVMAAVASGDHQAIQNLQAMASGQGQIGELETPEPKIGERVLSRDLAYLAWRLVRQQGLSLREAADTLTRDYGAPCSHATVANYVDDIDMQMEEEKQARRSGMFKSLFILTITIIAGVVIGHFFF